MIFIKIVIDISVICHDDNQRRRVGCSIRIQKTNVRNDVKNCKLIWFLFPGLGGQWTEMAKALMPIKIFADKVEECHQILSEFGID